jgi:hypothetical protein
MPLFDKQFTFNGRQGSILAHPREGSAEADSMMNPKEKPIVSDDFFVLGRPEKAKKIMDDKTFIGLHSPMKPVPNTVPSSKPPKPADISLAYKDWSRSKAPQDMDRVLTHAKDIIEKGITAYSGVDSPLMRSRAKVLAIQAIKSYDSKSGSALPSWIMTNLQGLTRYRQRASPIKIPERVQYELHHLNQSEQELTDTLGRDPSVDELSDRTGLSPKRITYIKKFGKSLRTEGSFIDEEGGSYLPGIPDDSWENVWAEFVYHDLDPINKKIYDMLVKESRPLNEVAAKLKISSSAVSQRAKRISDMLAQGQKVNI